MACATLQLANRARYIRSLRAIDMDVMVALELIKA